MKGQFTIIGVIIILISLVVLGAFAPVINDQVEILKNATENTTYGGIIATVGDLILPLMVLAIIVSIIVFATPQRE